MRNFLAKGIDKYFWLRVSLGLILPIVKAQAVCPICTFVVGAGIGLSRWFNIDDSITGLWIGGLIASASAWTIDWLDRHNIHFSGRKILVIFSYYAISIVPLYYMGIMGNAANKLWGLDKILLGIILGTIVFSVGAIYYQQLKKKNNGHAYFRGQKIIMPIGALLFLSAIFYYITI